MEYFTDKDEFARFNSGTSKSEKSSGDVVQVSDEIEGLDKADEDAIGRKRFLQRTAFAKTSVVTKKSRDVTWP